MGKTLRNKPRKNEYRKTSKRRVDSAYSFEDMTRNILIKQNRGFIPETPFGIQSKIELQIPLHHAVASRPINTVIEERKDIIQAECLIEAINVFREEFIEVVAEKVKNSKLFQKYCEEKGYKPYYYRNNVANAVLDMCHKYIKYSVKIVTSKDGKTRCVAHVTFTGAMLSHDMSDIDYTTNTIDFKEAYIIKHRLVTPKNIATRFIMRLIKDKDNQELINGLENKAKEKLDKILLCSSSSKANFYQEAFGIVIGKKISCLV